MSSRRRRLAQVAALSFAALAAILLASPRNPIGYLARQGWFELDLLWGRVPVERALAAGGFTPEQEANLRRVAEIKDFGRKIGLSATENYDTVNPTWDHTIWNLSACRPFAFRSMRWWFPVVGSMPYLGFFREGDARARLRELQAEGWDVYVRTAGAYSTLGWFADPILPDMLDWDEYELADTILHELTHATLWIKGSAQFNESFANVVGEHAALDWVASVHGPDSSEVSEVRRANADAEKYHAVLHALYDDLDRLYLDDSLADRDKIVRKGALYASLPVRVAAAGLDSPDRYVLATSRGTWNNARLVQFRTYNRGSAWFEQLVAEQHGDLAAFIARVKQITDGAEDPWKALAAAVGADPEDVELGDG